jgi:hypothetical protein
MNEVVWETLLGAGARFSFPLRSRRAAAVQAVLMPGGERAQRYVNAPAVNLSHRLRCDLRQTVAVWRRRENDLIVTLQRDHARMSATLVQGRLFDRRSDRIAAAQAQLLEDALSSCRTRMRELDACEDFHMERCDVTFAVVFG